MTPFDLFDTAPNSGRLGASRNDKGPESLGIPGLLLPISLVAGAGFEPATFGL